METVAKFRLDTSSVLPGFPSSPALSSARRKQVRQTFGRGTSNAEKVAAPSFVPRSTQHHCPHVCWAWETCLELGKVTWPCWLGHSKNCSPTDCPPHLFSTSEPAYPGPYTLSSYLLCLSSFPHHSPDNQFFTPAVKLISALPSFRFPIPLSCN